MMMMMMMMMFIFFVVLFSLGLIVSLFADKRDTIIQKEE
jgi:outer membrane lipoprotein-sorting protein